MIRTYVDTNVLIKAFRGQDAGLAAAAIAVLEDPEREFVGSSFMKLELLPQATFHRRPHEITFYQRFFAQIEQWAEIDEALVEEAIIEAGKYTLGAMDALHIAAARRLKVDEFITAEKPEKPLHRIKLPKIIAL
jgi:hypothetical protein